MAQTLSAKKQNIIENPVSYIKEYFGSLSEEQLLKTLQSDSQSTSQQSSQVSNQISGGYDFSSILERDLGIEGSIDLRNTCIPRLNDCKSAEEVAKLHHKLVRFDCMIQD